MIAVCTPELNGDVLWAVPAARELARRAGEKVDFWLGPRGRQTADLLAAQDFVARVFVDETYEVAPPGGSHELLAPKRHDPPYEHVHQLGFKQGMELRGTLLDYFCSVVGLPRQAHYFDLPPGYPTRPLPEGPFVALGIKGTDQGMMAVWAPAFREFVRRCPVPVVEVGVPGAAVCADALDRTSPGFLEMASIISKCKVFVGTISAPLVLADAFPHVNRVACHDNRTWNLEFCTTAGGMNHYPVSPTGAELADFVGRLL